jgi:Holliday junction resolvase
MDGPLRLLSPSSICPGCPLAETCGAALTDYACPETWSSEMPGGDAVSHPNKPGTMEELRDLGGPEFDDIVARPTPRLDLPPYTPQIRHRKSLRGYLDEPVYFIRATGVIKSNKVTTAAEMRRALLLKPEQRLIVLLFDRDKLIESIWTRGAALVRELVDAGYDAIVCPSFSTYTPRPRTDYMINMKRSLIYFEVLQTAGAHAIPRVAWTVSHDARRLANWAQDNRAVEMVAIDLSTYRSPTDWQKQIEGLEIFDSMTERRISYLINGSTTQERCEQLYEVAGVDRIRISNVTTQVQVPAKTLRSTGDQTGPTFKARLGLQREVVDAAGRRFRGKGRQAA